MKVFKNLPSLTCTTGLVLSVMLPSVGSASELPPQVNSETLKQYYVEEISYYLQKVNRAANTNSHPSSNPSCYNSFAHIINKGTMNISYVVGYMDTAGSKQSNYGDDGTNYGVARSHDKAMYEAMINRLTAPCRYAQQTACDFKITNSTRGYSKLSRVIDFFNRPLQVNIDIAHSSLNEIYEENISATNRSQQEAFSARAESLFLNGILNADIAFYNGHSRSGGGPDFRPPKLLSNNHTNYAPYKKEQNEIRKVLAALKARTDKNLILGLFSCSSNSHFGKMIAQAKPGLKTILSGDLIFTNEATTASAGYLEALLRGNCSSDLTNTARQSDRVKYGITDYNF